MGVGEMGVGEMALTRPKIPGPSQHNGTSIFI